jgi:sigma-54-specific transcriptional regulator
MTTATDLRSILTLPAEAVSANPIRASAVVFEDSRSRLLLRHIEKIAPSDATVLITGETGTGKEIVARQVHALSRRSQSYFLSVNCAALTESLVESELFGHERGAFTGAVKTKIGWFESAQGGTLFLDEIGDLPLRVQVKLLRVLQEHQVVRVGGRHPIDIDVRVIAATNINLEEAVAAGHFREDLYYRLNVAMLALPPLRERPGDIIPLAHHFLNIYSARLKLAGTGISAEAENVLQHYAWPGNIRELENAIHHALLTCPGGFLRETDLQLYSSLAARVPPSRSAQTSASVARRNLLKAGLLILYESAPDKLYDLIDEEVVQTAFEFCHRNQVQTAHLLGISRNVLRAKLQRLGLIGGSNKSRRGGDFEKRRLAFLAN